MASFFAYIPDPKERENVQAPQTKKTKKKTKKVNPTNTNTHEETIDASSCDILHIDENIKNKLKAGMSSLGEMKKTLSDLIWIASNGIDNADKLKADSETHTIKRAIQDIEGGFDLTLYMLRTSSLLEEYVELNSETSRNTFVKVQPRNEKAHQRKMEIVDEYLRIAKDYITIENIPKRSKEPQCENCKGKNLIEKEDHALVCGDCGVQIDLLDDAPSFKDSERVNMAARYTYSCKGHFIEAMNRFEGKQNREISEKVVKKLKEQLHLHGLGEENKHKITKDHIYMFMSENGYSTHYADINLIDFLLTERDPPDITNYREELLEMLVQSEEAYAEVKDKNRMNSLNVNWKLYKLLQLLDYPCKKDDFFCLKTPTKQGEHEEKWFEMIEYLKLKYPNAKTSKGKPRWRHLRSI